MESKMENTATPASGPVNEEVQFDTIMDRLGGDDPAPIIQDDAETDTPGDVAEVTPEEEVEAQAEDEESDAETPEEQATSDLDMAATVKVKVNGEEREVTLEEALKGYSRTEDYKSKTATLAEERRATAANYAERLEKAADIFVRVDPVLSQMDNIDWDHLAANDPANYVKLQHSKDERLKLINSVMQEVDAENAQAKAETLLAVENELFAATPELVETAQKQEFLQGIQEFLAPLGTDVASVAVDFGHEGVLIVRDAMLYRKSQQAKATIGEKKVPPKPLVKPLTPKSSQSPRATMNRPGPNSTSQQAVDWVLSKI